MGLIAQGPSRTQRAVIVIVGVVPSLIVAVCGVVALSMWRDELPDLIASHWNSNGVDGTTSVTAGLVIVLVTGVVGMAAGLASALCLGVASLVRIVLGTMNMVVVTVGGAIPVVAAGQRGLTDATDAAFPLGPTIGLLVTSAVIGVVTAAAVPGWTPVGKWADTRSGRRPTAKISASERFLWSQSTTMSPVLLGVLVASLIAGLVITLLTAVWIAVAVFAVVGILVVSLATARVTVDRHAVVIRATLGRPRITVPMTEIEHADVVTVRALRDFGGYGYRLGFAGEARGAKGFVLRSGQALLITRRSGSREVVVVDKAETAAGLVNATVAARSAR